MTIEAKKRVAFTKKARVRRPNIRRGPGGSLIMDFVEDPIDNGAPEFYVTGLASVEKIGRNQVRFTKYSKRRDGNVVTHHEVWDIERYKRDFANYEQALQLIERLPEPDGGDDGRRRETH